MADEQASRRAGMEYQFYQNQLQEVQNNLDAIEASIQDANAAIDALGNLSPNSPLILPLGGGVLIKVNVEDAKKVLVDSGARVFSKKTPNEAKVILLARKEKLESASKRLREDASELMMRLSDLRSKMEVG